MLRMKRVCAIVAFAVGRRVNPCSIGVTSSAPISVRSPLSQVKSGRGASLNCRVFAPSNKKAIPPNVLRRILEAGRHTPTAHNVQPWHFIVVSDPETKEQLSITGKFLQNAALILVGCGDPEDSPK